MAGEERKLQVRGLFYGIGHMPNSGLVAGQMDLDEKGYVKVPAACLCPYVDLHARMLPSMALPAAQTSLPFINRPLEHCLHFLFGV